MASPLEQVGFTNLTDTEKAQFATIATAKIANYFGRVPISSPCGAEKSKEPKEFWKRAAELGVSWQPFERPTYDWGCDEKGRSFGEYTCEEFDRLLWKQGAAEREREPLPEPQSTDRKDDNSTIPDKEMEPATSFSREVLYAAMPELNIENDEWKGLEPIPLDEGVDTLASIIYPPEYASGMR